MANLLNGQLIQMEDTVNSIFQQFRQQSPVDTDFETEKNTAIDSISQRIVVDSIGIQGVIQISWLKEVNVPAKPAI